VGWAQCALGPSPAALRPPMLSLKDLPLGLPSWWPQSAVTPAERELVLELDNFHKSCFLPLREHKCGAHSVPSVL
jgi:hypothetical protein